jgi:hypothetical protein
VGVALPLILVILIGVGVWRALSMQQEAGQPRPQMPKMKPLPTKGRKVARRIGIVAVTWAIVTGAASFIDISIALFTGMFVIVAGAVWVFRTADPMQIDMDELDRELMKLLEDES